VTIAKAGKSNANASEKQKARKTVDIPNSLLSLSYLHPLPFPLYQSPFYSIAA
jgi:hypothetical protein